jgi:hypothetical protein
MHNAFFIISTLYHNKMEDDTHHTCEKQEMHIKFWLYTLKRLLGRHGRIILMDLGEKGSAERGTEMLRVQICIIFNRNKPQFISEI